ncbi:MAG: 30S ribosomal protein S6, partial [Patescibacteria group bacterium]
MESPDTKTYELAYHLNPDLEEATVRTQVQELNDLIAQNGGSVLISSNPRKSHLSYPIKNKHYAYFGIMEFGAMPEVIEKVNAQMKLQNSVMRYLLLAKPDIKELRIL